MRLFVRRLAGFFVLFMGISIFFHIIGFGEELLGTLLFLGIGYLLYKHVSQWLGIVLFALAGMAFLFSVLNIEAAELVLAALFIYFGYLLFAGKGLSIKKRKGPFRPQDRGKDWLDEEIEALTRERMAQKEEPLQDSEPPPRGRSQQGVKMKMPRYQNYWIGDLHLIHNRFELGDMNISGGIGDIKIDLSKAIIPEGENSIVISKLIGSVDIYMPFDLEASVEGSVMIGDLEVLGQEQEGFNRQIHVETNGYALATRKVKISISLLIGSVSVRYL